MHVVQSEAKTSQDSDPEVEESVPQPVVGGEMLKVATRGQRDVMTRGCPEVAEKLRAPLPPPTCRRPGWSEAALGTAARKASQVRCFIGKGYNPRHGLDKR